MFVDAVAVVLADVVVAEEAIAFIALGADGIPANGGPVTAMDVVGNCGVAIVRVLEVHTDTPGIWPESIPQVAS